MFLFLSRCFINVNPSDFGQHNNVSTIASQFVSEFLNTAAGIERVRKFHVPMVTLCVGRLTVLNGRRQLFTTILEWADGTRGACWSGLQSDLAWCVFDSSSSWSFHWAFREFCVHLLSKLLTDTPKTTEYGVGHLRYTRPLNSSGDTSALAVGPLCSCTCVSNLSLEEKMNLKNGYYLNYIIPFIIFIILLSA